MKRMSVFALLLMVFMMTFGAFVAESQAALSSNKRRAVVLECFKALRPTYDGGCDKTITNGSGTWCVSNWNYLDNDWYAYNYMKNAYRCNSSNWRTGTETDGFGCQVYYSPVSFYLSSYPYGYGTYGGNNGDVGRGGQCKYFANLILYRSGSDQNILTSYAAMNLDIPNQGDPALAKQGDVLFTLQEGSNYNIWHTAIVVELKPDGLDVIDSNYVSDISGTPNREVIARHLLTWAYLSSHAYKVWKGVSYYGTDYIP